VFGTAFASLLSLNRIAFGLFYVARPRAGARGWIGAGPARLPWTQLFARAVGARDLALGAGALGSLARGDRSAARGWMAAHAIADGTDLAATVAARRALPKKRFKFAVGMAGASTAVAAVSAWALGRGGSD